MALIECIECKKEYSDKSSACINCGCPTVDQISATTESIEEHDTVTHTSQDTTKDSLWVSFKKEINGGDPNLKRVHYLMLIAVVVGFVVMGANYYSQPTYQKPVTKKVTHPLLESKAIVSGEFFDKPKNIDVVVNHIRQSGYVCNSVSSLLQHVYSRGLTVTCNNYMDTYEIKRHGGHWKVTVK